MINYEAKADPKMAFQFPQHQFVKLGWNELPDSRVEASYAVGQFQKSNDIVSLSTSDVRHVRPYGEPGTHGGWVRDFAAVCGDTNGDACL